VFDTKIFGKQKLTAKVHPVKMSHDSVFNKDIEVTDYDKPAQLKRVYTTALLFDQSSQYPTQKTNNRQLQTNRS